MYYYCRTQFSFLALFFAIPALPMLLVIFSTRTSARWSKKVSTFCPVKALTSMAAIISYAIARSWASEIPTSLSNLRSSLFPTSAKGTLSLPGELSRKLSMMFFHFQTSLKLCRLVMSYTRITASTDEEKALKRAPNVSVSPGQQIPKQRMEQNVPSHQPRINTAHQQ